MFSRLALLEHAGTKFTTPRPRLHTVVDCITPNLREETKASREQDIDVWRGRRSSPHSLVTTHDRVIGFKTDFLPVNVVTHIPYGLPLDLW